MRPLLGTRSRPRGAERYGFIYSFSIAEQHPDRKQEKALAALWDKTVEAKMQLALPPVTPAAQAVLDWFKAHLTPGRIYSVAEDLFEVLAKCV